MFSTLFSENSKLRRDVMQNAKEILSYLSVALGERTLRKYTNLNLARNYIKDYFRIYGYEPYEEKYTVEGKEVANIVAEIKGFEDPDQIILLGAHYDTVEDTPGADDNGSAVAGLLEIFRLLSQHKFKKTIRFVAFTLEEPPFFSTDQMGSMHYARLCRERNENIELMICLEMIGYAGKGYKQDYPPGNMYEIPLKGDFLTVVSFPSGSEYAYLWKKNYNNHAKRHIFEMIGPASIPGVGLSDHASFIKYKYPAIMICDTGFYRNKNYHTENDTFETINFKFLTENIINSFLTIRDLLNMKRLLK